MTVANKIIYGNNTLIDLTGDTATASDVVSGKTFHLASGIQATGTLAQSPIKTVTIRIDTNYDNSIVFNGVTSEPSWFVVVGTSYSSSSAYNNPVVYVLYDGTKTSMMYITAVSSSKVQRTIKSSTTTASYPRFSYDGSSSKLTVSVASSATSSNPNFQMTGDKYTLYYL